VTVRDEALFEGLPAPERGRLTLYVFGPGVGESQVVALPDGRWMVVDTCKLDEVTLPLALLRHFGAPRVDLLVVTHPDRDHYKGLPELIKGIDVKCLWRYRGFHHRRKVLTRLCELNPENGRKFADLRLAEEAMAPFMEHNGGFEVAIDSCTWPNEQAYEVTCIAPCPADLRHEGEQLHALFRVLLEAGSEGVALDPGVERFLLGKARGVDGKGNPISLALVIRWRGIGILLGGDVEAPRTDASRGWSGILTTLERGWPKGLDLVRDLHVVKVSHHGSWGAFSEDAWKLHAETGAVEVAVVTPFRGNEDQPPHRETFRALGRFAKRVALPSPPSYPTKWDHLEDPPRDHGAWERLADTGWLQVTVPQGPGAGACVAVTFDAISSARVAVSRQGGLFEPSAAPPVGG